MQPCRHAFCLNRNLLRPSMASVRNTNIAMATCRSAGKFTTRGPGHGRMNKPKVMPPERPYSHLKKSKHTSCTNRATQNVVAKLVRTINCGSLSPKLGGLHSEMGLQNHDQQQVSSTSHPCSHGWSTREHGLYHGKEEGTCPWLVRGALKAGSLSQTVGSCGEAHDCSYTTISAMMR